MIRIPESLSDVSPEWLTAALRSAGHLGKETVVVGDIQPIGAESGFASQVGRIRLAFDPPTSRLPTSIVVKMASAARDEAQSQMLEDSYARECAFYSLIWPNVGVRTPVCYYVAHEAEPPRFVLLLEDLAAARLGDAAVGWSRDDARLVVDALAALHATWWNDPRLSQWKWLLPFGDATAQLKTLAGRRATFVERHRQDVSPDLQRLTMRLGAPQAELIRRLGGSPCTLLHVDTHLDNIAFFDEVTATPILFDWQRVGKGLCVVDLTSFLSGGSIEQRRMFERELIERYHRRLTAAGVTGYSLEMLMADYVVALLRWWIGTVNGLGSSRAGAWAGRQAELASAWKANTTYALVSHRVHRVLVRRVRLEPDRPNMNTNREERTAEA